MTRLIAVVSTLSIAGFLLVYFPGGPVALAYLLFGVAAGSIMILLVRVYTVVSKYEGAGHGAAHQYRMRGHILLNVIPSSYVILQFVAQPTITVDLLYLPPVMLFFWTGRQTWSALYEQFGSKLYQFFCKGNTGMLVGLPVLLGLGMLYDETIGGGFFRRVLLSYFAIHLLLIGVAVVKIEKDFDAAKQVV